MLQDRGNVARDEKFIFAEADDDGWAESSGNDLLRIFGRKSDERVGAGDDFYGFLDGFFERNAALGIFLDQVG